MTDRPIIGQMEIDALNKLTIELERLNGQRVVRIQNSLWKFLTLQLARGMAFGLGSVLGATLLVSVIGWWLSQFEFVPIIGEWATEILDQMESKGDPGKNS